MVMVDDVELNNLTFIENQSFINNYGSVILVTSTNVSLVNNKINYNAPKNSESYVIYADGADELKLISNDITFTNELIMNELFTNAIYVTDSWDVLIKNNTMDITIPSVDIDYGEKLVETVYSEGVVLENCDNAVITENNIAVKYSSVVGNIDTLRAVDIKGGDNVALANNTITVDGHKYAYALVIGGNDFNLFNNSISATSDINYANGVNINGPASGILTLNTVSSIAPNASYPIYSASYAGNVYAEYENNTVYGNAHDVYGIYLSGTDENLTNNHVLVEGNFTIGIASSSSSIVISNNTIYSPASNMGQPLNLDEIPCNTSGITSIRGNNVVDVNIIETTGKYSVNIQNGQVTNNYLIANTTCGDKSVYPKGSSVLIENNLPLMKTANLTVNNISLNIGDEIAFNVTLTDTDNNPLVNYTVALNVNGSKYQATTDVNGIATFELDSLPVGIYEMEFVVDSEDIIELIQENAILNITLNDLNVNINASNIHEEEDLIINVTVPDNLDEDLIIKINNSTYLIKNSDSIVISNLSAGNYHVTVYYPGDDYYNEYNDEFNVTVYEKDEIVVDINEPVEGEDLIIDVNGPKDITGNVTISVGNEKVDVPFVNGNANLTISNISKGFYPISIDYPGDGTHSPYSFEGNVTVNPKIVPKENLTLEAIADPITAGENASVVVTGFEDATGNVTVAVGDAIYTAVIVGGTAAVVIPGLTENATALISYPGDDKYNNASTAVDIVVYPKPKENATIVIDVPEVTEGENVTVTVTLPEDATGTVTVGNEVVGVVNGTASAVLTNLPVGNTTVPVTYSGDDKYNNASTTVDIVVYPKPKENATIVIDVPEVTEGENVTVTVTLPEDATGTVTVGNEVVGVVNGTASAVLTNLPVGNTTVPVTYSGDDKYNPIETNVTVTVDEKPVLPKENLTLEAVADPISAGENASVVVTGFEDATGNVTVAVGDAIYTAVIVGGTAAVVIPGLTENATALISYPGDDKYNNASTAVDIVVYPKPKENATIVIDVPEVTEGENVTVTVTLPEDATGTVTVGNEVVGVVNGTASAVLTNLPVGNTTVLVTYSGDDKYNPIWTNVTVTVDEKPVPPKENLTLEAVADPIIPGENASVVVTGFEDATGNVTVAVGDAIYTAVIVGGTAAVVIPGLTENATALISYPGDDKYNNASTTIDIVVCPKSKENATITIDVSPVTEGQNTTINVELPEDATGNVTATVNNETYSVSVKNGKATITIPELAAGNYTIPVTYSGDDKYNSETKDVIITVEEDKFDIISAPDVTKYFHGSERFVVTVTDYQGNPLANKSVIISINGISYTRSTNANGTASIALGLNSGVYNVTATVDNRTISSIVTILSTVNGTDIVKMYRNGTQYFATFLDSEGKYLADGTTVQFNINGVMYDRKVSGDKGLARLNINLNAGEYIITALNPVTGDKAANNITVLPLLTENKDITKYYRNGTQYTVKVLGADGKAVGAGVTVRFNINGVFYERQTNASGIAKININLQTGDYIITAEYNGCMVSNNIKVLPILNATDISMKYRDGTQFKANLVDGQGKSYANQAVTFNINGVFYNRSTDANGQAKLNINLMPGEYIITSSYNGSSIANTIKISA